MPRTRSHGQLIQHNRAQHQQLHEYVNYMALQQQLHDARFGEGVTSMQRVGAQISMPHEAAVSWADHEEGLGESHGQACAAVAEGSEGDESSRVPEKGDVASQKQALRDQTGWRDQTGEPLSPLQRRRQTVMQSLGRELISHAGTARQAYKAFDSSRGGEVTLVQFLDGLARMRIDHSKVWVLNRGVDRVFQMLDTGGTGFVNMREILAIQNEGDPKNMETSELWRKCVASENSRSENRSGKPELTLSEEGEFRLQEIDAIHEQLRHRRGIQRHWESVRLPEQRQAQPPFDPRLHHVCNDIILGKRPKPGAAVCEHVRMTKRAQRIRAGLHDCSSSRHQVVELQRMLKPRGMDEVHRRGSRTSIGSTGVPE